MEQSQTLSNMSSIELDFVLLHCILLDSGQVEVIRYGTPLANHNVK